MSRYQRIRCSSFIERCQRQLDICRKCYYAHSYIPRRLFRKTIYVIFFILERKSGTTPFN